MHSNNILRHKTTEKVFISSKRNSFADSVRWKYRLTKEIHTYVYIYIYIYSIYIYIYKHTHTIYEYNNRPDFLPRCRESLGEVDKQLIRYNLSKSSRRRKIHTRSQCWDKLFKLVGRVRGALWRKQSRVFFSCFFLFVTFFFRSFYYFTSAKGIKNEKGGGSKLFKWYFPSSWQYTYNIYVPIYNVCIYNVRLADHPFIICLSKENIRCSKSKQTYREKQLTEKWKIVNLLLLFISEICLLSLPPPFGCNLSLKREKKRTKQNNTFPFVLAHRIKQNEISNT